MMSPTEKPKLAIGDGDKMGFVLKARMDSWWSGKSVKAAVPGPD